MADEGSLRGSSEVVAERIRSEIQSKVEIAGLEIVVDVHAARPEGKSSYSLVKLLRLASDNIITFSNKPLKMMTLLGAGIAAVSVAVMAVYLVLALMGEIKVAGYASLILSIWFVCGALMTMLGVVGVYLGKVFNQTKGRPKFIISEVIGCEEE